MKYIDLTHIFTDNMPVYPGDHPTELRQTAQIDKDGCTNFQVKTGMHVGTHMDGPLHMIPNGKSLSDFPVSHFFGPANLVDARNKSEIGLELLKNREINPGDIILILTGFSGKYHQLQYYENYREITEEFAQKLFELKVKIVGMDTPSPDRPPFKVHKILLSNDILIIENLTNLGELLKYEKFNIIALPTKFASDSAPVRVVAEIV